VAELPRVLLCSFDVLPAPTGASRRLSEYLRALADRFQVVVLSSKTPDHSHIERYHGARLLRVPVGSGDLASKVEAFERAVRRQLDSEEYAIAHVADPFCGYAVAELRAEYSYRLVYEAHTFPSQELRYTHPQLEGDRRLVARIRRQELFCLMSADRVLTGSAVARSFIRSLGVPADRVEILRAPAQVVHSRAQPAGPLRVLYLGSQVLWQGLPTLLHGVARAAKQVNLELVIAGPRHSAWQPLLEDQVVELGLKERVAFVGPVADEQLEEVLATAHLGVLPLEDLDRNRTQGGPLAKAADYLAAGLPIVAADLPVTRELLPEATTLFHRPGDAETLAEALIELARNAPVRARLAQASRAEAGLVDPAGLHAALLRVYAELIDAPAGATGPVAQPSEPDTQSADLGTEPSAQVLPQAETEPPKTDPAIPALGPTDPLVPVASPPEDDSPTPGGRLPPPRDYPGQR
jgi:glycosyltransferase involved in cell wall biosynthesis